MEKMDYRVEYLNNKFIKCIPSYTFVQYKQCALLFRRRRLFTSPRAAAAADHMRAGELKELTKAGVEFG